MEKRYETFHFGKNIFQNTMVLFLLTPLTLPFSSNVLSNRSINSALVWALAPATLDRDNLPEMVLLQPQAVIIKTESKTDTKELPYFMYMTCIFYALSILAECQFQTHNYLDT
jgi:hypothetical protein